MVLCFPEPGDRVLFQVAVTRFEAGERALTCTDRSFLRMQTVMGHQFGAYYARQGVIPDALPHLEHDYQQIFALYWEGREGKE